MLSVNYWLLRKVDHDLSFVCGVVTPGNQRAGYGRSNQVRDQAPDGVEVPSDVRLRQRQRQDELDHFVQSTKAH